MLKLLQEMPKVPNNSKSKLLVAIDETTCMQAVQQLSSHNETYEMCTDPLTTFSFAV
jgi:hypothetical protein